MFPQAAVDLNSAPDVALAILAGELVQRCCSPECGHWGRRSSSWAETNHVNRDFRWWCVCCVRGKTSTGHALEKGDFLCDGTRV